MGNKIKNRTFSVKITKHFAQWGELQDKLSYIEDLEILFFESFSELIGPRLRFFSLCRPETTVINLCLPLWCTVQIIQHAVNDSVSHLQILTIVMPFLSRMHIDLKFSLNSAVLCLHEHVLSYSCQSFLKAAVWGNVNFKCLKIDKIEAK